MRELLRGRPVALRPHAKAHKSSAFAAWQLRTAAAAGEPLAEKTVFFACFLACIFGYSEGKSEFV